VLFNPGLIVVKWNQVNNSLEKSGRSVDSECAFHEIPKDDTSYGFQEIWS